jgi:hypothetical protein
MLQLKINMNIPSELIAIIVILIIIGGAIFYIIKSKKKGNKCIGCPYSKQCSKNKKNNCCSNNDVK